MIIVAVATALVISGAIVGGVYFNRASSAQTELAASERAAQQADREQAAKDKASRARRAAAVAEAEAARQRKAEEARKAAEAKAKAEAAKKAKAEAAARAKAKAEAAAKAKAKAAAAAKAKAEAEAKKKQASSPADKYSVTKTVTGLASYFGDASEYQPMACGGNTRELTKGVALWTIPCGTLIRITSKETGKSVIAPVRDRGPASWTGVAIDLLPDTWDALGVSRGQGKQQVTYEVLDANIND